MEEDLKEPKEDVKVSREPKVRKERPMVKHSFLSFRVGLTVGCFIVFVLVAFFGGLIMKNPFNTKSIKTTHAMLSSQIQKVAELTVIKNHYCNIAAVKAEVMGGFSKAYNIVKFNGIIRIGISDVSQITVTLSKDEKQVKVRIPHCQILGNDITDMESFDERRGLFVSVDTQMVFDEIKVAKKETEEALLADGILTDADAQLESVVSGMLVSMGYEIIDVSWIGD